MRRGKGRLFFLQQSKLHLLRGNEEEELLLLFPSYRGREGKLSGSPTHARTHARERERRHQTSCRDFIVIYCGRGKFPWNDKIYQKRGEREKGEKGEQGRREWQESCECCVCATHSLQLRTQKPFHSFFPGLKMSYFLLLSLERSRIKLLWLPISVAFFPFSRILSQWFLVICLSVHSHIASKF